MYQNGAPFNLQGPESGRFKPYQPLLFDHDWCAFIDKIEQLDYVRIAHPHASMARRVADFVLVLGAVNIKEADRQLSAARDFEKQYRLAGRRRSSLQRESDRSVFSCCLLPSRSQIAKWTPGKCGLASHLPSM